VACSGDGGGKLVSTATQQIGHVVEFVDVGFFNLSGPLAGEAHNQKHEIIFGYFPHGAFFAFSIDIINETSQKKQTDSKAG
jgi:hypothetical protein